MNNSLFQLSYSRALAMMSKDGVVNYQPLSTLIHWYADSEQEAEEVMFRIGSDFPCKVGEPA